MPLPSMLKNIIGNHAKNDQTVRSNSTDAVIQNVGKPNNGKPKTMSEINGMHSHKNMKIAHQIQLAESMYDPSWKISLDSCFQCQFPQCLADEHFLANFVQFIESTGEKGKKLIRCFLQANCLKSSFLVNFAQIDFDALQDSLDIEDDKLELYNQFIEDFHQLYDSIQSDDDLDEELAQLCETSNSDKRDLQVFHRFSTSLCHRIETIYLEHFLKSNHFLKYELDVVRNRTLTLSDILFSNTFIETAFLDFINTEDTKDYMDFLLMYKNYKVYSCQYSDALAIFERFFNTLSSSHLAFSETILLELSMAMNENHFSQDCYDKLASILVQYFSKTYLPQFFESEQYRSYLQDVESKLSCDRHKSAKVSNMEQVVHGTSNLSLNTTHWSEERGRGQLQFTYIDRYGRMNSLTNTDASYTASPASPAGGGGGGGKLSQVIKKFAFNSHDIEKEDNEWKIAESIVNDVCSLTIPHHSKH